MRKQSHDDRFGLISDKNALGDREHNVAGVAAQRDRAGGKNSEEFIAEFAVEKIPGKGRGIVYHGSIVLPEGIEILRCAPYAAVLQKLLWTSRCSSCFQPLKKLSVCTGCGCLHFCDTSCQKKAWAAGHSRECPKLREFVRICEEANVPDDDVTDFLLLGRTLHKMRGSLNSQRGAQQPENPNCASPSESQNDQVKILREKILILRRFKATRPSVSAKAFTDLVNRRSPVVEATANDTANMCVTTGNELLKSPEHISLLHASPICPNTSLDEIRFYLNAFQCNNFAISDSNLVPIGAGVYPLASLLNHSCCPNIVVSYDVETQIQSIRSIRPISPGEELLHLYVDAALPAIERRLTLQATYDFICECPLCIEPDQDRADYEKMCRADFWKRQICGLDGLDQWIYVESQKNRREPFGVESGSPLPISSSVSTTSFSAKAVDSDCAPPPLLDVGRELWKLHTDFADVVTFSEVPTGDQVGSLQKYIKRFKELLHPDNLDLYTKRCALFTAASLLSGSSQPASAQASLPGSARDIAISEGLELIKFLLRVYKHVPNHPLIALQYHAVGDLYEDRGDLRKAQKLLYRAYYMLNIALGSHDNLVKSLAYRLDTLRGHCPGTQYA